MSKKIKKIFAALAGSSLIFAPAALSAACGNTGGSSSSSTGGSSSSSTGGSDSKGSSSNFSKIDGNKVIFGVTFSNGKDQWNAIQDIVDNYNKDMKNNKDFVEVELKNIGSGYSGGHDNVVTGMKNLSNELPSLTVNYGSTIAEIAKYGRQFNFNDASVTGAENVISPETFEEKFNSFNDKIQGVKEGGNYSLPIFKSTIAFGINGPIYKYVFTTLRDAGYVLSEDIKEKFKTEDTEAWKEDINYIKQPTIFGAAKEVAEIKTIFGEPKGGTTVDFSVDSVFGSFDGLMKFITKAIQMFATSAQSGSASRVALLGIDDPSGSLNTFLYSKVKGKDSRMPMKVTANDEGIVTVDFNSISDPNNETTKSEEEMYDLIAQAILKGALKIYGGGSYSSADETSHLLGANFGSTAGYTHNFISSPVPEVQYKDSNNKFIKIASVDESPEAGKISLKYKNSVVAFGTSKPGKYDYVAKTEEDNAGISDSTGNSKITPGSKYLIVKASEKDAVNALSTQTEHFEKLGTFVQRNTDYIIYKITTPPSATTEYGSIKYVVNTPASTLQKEELVVLMPPSKYNSESTTQTAFVQGPNLYGIRKNDKLDKATALFVKYLTSTDERTFTEKSRGQIVTVNESNFEHISRIAGYAVPFKGFAEAYGKTGSKLANALNFNKYLELTVNVFKNDSIKLYEEPASVNSNPYRDTFNSSYKSAATQIRENGSVIPFKTAIVSDLTAKIKLFTDN